MKKNNSVVRFRGMTTKLTVKKRVLGKDALSVRADGEIPAVVYGPKYKTVSLSVNRKEFTKLFEDAGESTIIQLEGLDEEAEVLVHDVSFDPVKGGVLHVDFYAIEKGKEINTSVPLEFIGEAPVTKQGSTVNKILHEVEITCRPSALPQHIDVDISTLIDDESHILVSDLVLPDGVTVDNNQEDVIANVSAVREEEEETPAEIDMSEIEVEGKGKETEEEVPAAE